MISPILIDSSFVYELNNPKTTRREQLAAFLRSEKRERIVPDVVLTEATYLIRERVGQRSQIRFLLEIDNFNFRFEPISSTDVKRAGQIMARYRDADLDFVDCCIMALSERLNVTSVYTFDRHDFAIFRPTHCDYLELLP